ncbi:hypothetical protein VCHC17A1_3993, partial [Vibrio cholerae HC-17A1]
MLRKSIEAKKR